MSTKIAPWLQGLDEAWEVPKGIKRASNVSSASHDASSLRSNNSRIPRRSLSGLSSSLGTQTTTSQASTQIKRSPLAPLSNTNTFHGNKGTNKSPFTRSVSETSEGSRLQCGTVQKRSKSASPIKKQETLEWKRRLVQGQLGYEDQTDLFGPSGLENIFARSKGPESKAPKPKNINSWLQKSDAPMPSSPPPWPSNLTSVPQAEQRGSLQRVCEDEDIAGDGDSDVEEHRDSINSNPFDLHNTDESQGTEHDGIADSSGPHQKQGLIGAHGSRMVSGQTELEQEDFSPVYVSKHTTINGQVDYAALDSHLVKQFQNVKVELRHPSQEEQVPEMRGDDDEESIVPEHSTFTDGPQSEFVPTAPDLSLSENLPTGTPPVAGLSQHVELQRGGYSRYGSFKQRPLSPSPLKDEGSVQQNAVDLPRERTPQPPNSRSPKSQLILFGAHDFFTTNRLLRRMSEVDSGEGLPRSHGFHEAQHQNGALSSPQPCLSSKTSTRNSFGSGELDSHVFDACVTITSASNSNGSHSDGSPGSEIPVPGSKIPLGFGLETSPEVKDIFKLKRKLSKHSITTSKASALEASQQVPMQSNVSSRQTSKSKAYHERAEEGKSFGGSKRPPTSPFKNPTPKRRRTLHASELQDEISESRPPGRRQLRKAVSTRKRKDARPGQRQNVVNHDILAQHNIQRPRNPTPSQQRRQEVETELREATEAFAAQEPERLEAVMEEMGSSLADSVSTPTLQQQAEAVASEVANFTLRIRKPSEDHGKRKRSVTTQDFLNEAMMVMNLIRAKARPHGGLGSVKESDGEGVGHSLHSNGSLQSAGRSLRLSRPPSREGRQSGWRPTIWQQTDARVVSHLRKFQENDDAKFVTDSLASLYVEDEFDRNDDVIAVDEEASIRITGPLFARAVSDDESRPLSNRSQSNTLHTHSSQESNATSTDGTLGTSSTRKSDNVGTLAPDAVAHLIGEQVAGMTFDKETQRWLRVKSPEKTKSAGQYLEPPSQLTSDDDPFREISDLPVDEQKELKRISSTGKTKTSPDCRRRKHDETDDATAEALFGLDSRMTLTEVAITRTETMDSSHDRHIHSSSLPARYTAFTSSQQHERVETRATSWSDEELAKFSALGKARQQPLAYAAAQATLALRSERAKLPQPFNADRSELSLPRLSAKDSSKNPAGFEEASNATSPSPDPQEGHKHFDGLREDTAVDLDRSEVEELQSSKLRQTPLQPPPNPPLTHRETTRAVSLRRKTLTSKFNAEAHEQSELSFVAALPGERMMSVSLSVSRPLTARYPHRHSAQVQSLPFQGESSFALSDLPEFTIHEEDAERPSERALATRLANHAAVQVDDRYAFAVKDLVKTLTDVCEEEPFWDDLKQLDLQDRSLISLYGLDDFCTRIQDMDVSHNVLMYLNGTPSTVRRLIARSNQLSSLTPWGQLSNLQYLDISGNRLESLRGLSCLVHLRELWVDDNQIADLAGILELDGLLKLRLRRNKLHSLDFGHCKLYRLTDLDVTSNKIMTIANLESLSALSTLTLDRNLLSPTRLAHNKMPRLESLSIQHCGLKSVYVDTFPNLRSLHVDDNHLANINGVESLRQLEVISIRRQTLRENVSVTLFDQPIEARSIRLSGNRVPVLQLHLNFMNLQELELASVGLQELPDNFGFSMPNLRTLNLNFNALRDLRSLLNIQKLEYLSACSNRLSRLRKTMATLAKMPSLRSLDLRDNPLTQGFYPPSETAQTSIIRTRSHHHISEDEDEHIRALEKAKHSLPRLELERDQQHHARLDENTKLKRRVYELLLAHSCHFLTEVDGLSFAKASIDVKDGIWKRLVNLGIVRRSKAVLPGAETFEVE